MLIPTGATRSGEIGRRGERRRVSGEVQPGWADGTGWALYGPRFVRSLIQDHMICLERVVGVGITVSAPAVMSSVVLRGLLA